MKKILLTLVVGVFALSSYSQSSLAVEEGKVRLGAFYSYDRNSGSERLALDEYAGYRAGYDQPNFSTGLSLDYQITEKVVLNTGINYSDRSFSTTYYCHVCDFVVPSQPEIVKLQFLEIPVTAKYYLLRSRVLVFGEAGAGNLFKINEDSNFPTQNYLLTATIGGGFEYPFLKKYVLQLSTSYHQNITEVFDQGDYTYRILGIKAGLLLKV